MSREIGDFGRLSMCGNACTDNEGRNCPGTCSVSHLNRAIARVIMVYETGILRIAVPEFDEGIRVSPVALSKLTPLESLAMEGK